jgi:hypothetical protein
MRYVTLLHRHNSYPGFWETVSGVKKPLDETFRQWCWTIFCCEMILPKNEEIEIIYKPQFSQIGEVKP